MGTIPPYHGHRRRIKERFLRAGFNGFHEYEIIEFLLFFALPRRDCKPLARQLITRFSNLAGVLEASWQDLAAEPGIGSHAACLLSSLKEVARLYGASRLSPGALIGSSAQAAEYFRVGLRHYEREVFEAVFVSAENDRIGSAVLFEGTIDQSAVYPRELIRAAVTRRSNRIIVGHNHLWRSARPSASDRELTRALVYSLGWADIMLLDHIVVSKNESYSFAEHGEIRRFEEEFATFRKNLLV